MTGWLRVLRFLIVTPLLFVAALVAVLLILVLTNPSPREAPGWTLAAPLPASRGETTTAVLEGRLYVIGGMAGIVPQTSGEVAVYDLQADHWTFGPPLPDPRHHAAAVALGSGIYLSGGASGITDWTPERNLWRLTDEGWTDLAPMPEGRWGHRMVAVEDRLFVIGGGGASVLIYDPAADAWSRGAPIPATRDHLAVAAAHGEIWAVGGRAGGELHERVDIYDPASDAWRPGPPLPAPTSGAAEAAHDGLILVSGGEDASPVGDGVFDRHWWIDTRQAETGWHRLPHPPLAVHGAEGAVVDGHFYVVGGASRAMAQSVAAWVSEAQVFDLAQLRR
jgi:N-acetylneuraminic acid mutarotase